MANLLVVDDVEQNRCLLQMLLMRHGHDVILAADGAEALEKARGNPPDLIISDILMPGMDGYALCRQWKHDEKLKGIPFVFYSATCIDPKDKQLALDMGAARFIRKPQDQKAFLGLIEEVIEEHRAGRRPPPLEPVMEETVYLKLYNEALVRKVENKLVELESAKVSLECEVAERKKVEDALRESEERLRDIMFNMVEWVWETDENGIYTYSSNRALGRPGLFSEDAIGKTPFDFMPPEEAKRVAPIFSEIVANKAPIKDLENWNVGKNGEIMCLLTNGVPIQDAEGNLKGYRGVDIDITQRKRAEGVLKDSEERFRTAAENLMDVIYDWDIKEKIDWYGDIDGIMGYPPGGFPRTITGWAATLHPEDKDRVMAALERQIKGVAPYTVEYRVRRKDGEWRWWSARGATLRDDQGAPYKMIGSVTDITDRMQAAEKLRESENEFFLLAESMPQIVWVTRKDGWNIYFNHQWMEYTGLTLEESYGHGWNIPFHPEDRQKAWDAWQNATNHHGTYSMECRLRRADGAYRWWLVRGAPLIDNAGEVLKWFGTCTDIHDIKLTEEKLQESETKFKSLFDYTRDAIFLADARTGIIFDANSAACDLIGLPRENVVGMHQAQLHPPEERGRYEGIFRQYVAEESGVAVDMVLQRADGTRIPVEISASAMELAGIPILQEYFRDISERKQAEHDLLASETRYRRLFESAKDGILILDAGTGQIVDVNPYLVELLGFDRESFLNKKVWEIGLFKDILASEAAFVELQEKKYIRYEDLPLETRDGRRIDVEFVSNVYLVDSAKVIQCNIRNITERKRTEAELRKLSMALRQSPVSVVITDLLGNIEYVNPKFTAITGYAHDEVLGQNSRLLKSGETSPEEYEILWKTITSGGEWRGEFHNKKKDGTLFWERVFISPICNAAGTITHFLGIKEDITEQKTLDEQYRQAQKMEAVGQLAGGVAHDFNNILQVMVGYCSMLLDLLPEHDETHEFVEEIANGVDRAAALTRQLLTFSRRQIMEMEDLELNEVVHGLTKMIRRIIGESIEVEVVEGGLGIVYADRGQMEQVLLNLCINARDAMPEGGALTIKTEKVEMDKEYCDAHVWATPGRYVLLSVTDTGCGMDAETQARIFEPFFTTKEVGQGTGLGLATVYGIVQQHQGMVQVYSEVAMGTTFKVYLPCVEQMAPTVAPTVVERARGGSETLLVAEDDEKLRELATRILESAGYTVLPAADGKEALDVFEKHAADINLCLLDVIMPKMGGKAVYDALHQQNPRLRFLFSSGYSMDAIHQGFVLTKDIELIQKPYAPNALLRRIRQILDEAIGDSQ